MPPALSRRRHAHECHAHADGCPCPLQNQAHCRGMMRCNEPLHLSSPAADALPADHARLAASAYLARFTGSSREHTQSDLHCYLRWCADRGLDPDVDGRRAGARLRAALDPGAADQAEATTPRPDPRRDHDPGPARPATRWSAESGFSAAGHVGTGDRGGTGAPRSPRRNTRRSRRRRGRLRDADRRDAGHPRRQHHRHRSGSDPRPELGLQPILNKES